MNEVTEIIVPDKHKGTLILIAACSLLLLSLISYLFIEAISLRKEVSNLKNSNVQFSKQITVLESLKPKDFTNDIQSLKDEQSKLSDDALSNLMNHQLTGRVITDDFVVERAFCTAVTKGNVFIMEIDLGTQPTFSTHYLGQGRFDVPDRDLKNSISEIVNQCIDTVSAICKNSGIDMKKGLITVSIKNYGIASYTDGTLKLNGE